MADHSTPQSSKTQVPNAQNNQPKLNFLHKAAVLTAFLVLLPLISSQPPDFINQSLLHSRSWELLQLVFVGIAVSYGLFSKKNDDDNHNDDAKEHQSSNFDNAQSYVSKLLQVSSVFDDESVENPTLIDESKVQTWSSQYYREKPVVVVAEESPSLKEESTVNTSRFSQKPLLLPVRSLKHRVSETDEVDSINESSVKRNGSFHSRSKFNSSGSRSFNTTNPRNKEIEELGGLNSQKMEENFAVLRSPVPWRSRSGRMEMKESGDGPPSNLVSPSMDGKVLDLDESSRSFRSSNNLNPPPNSVAPSPSVSLPRKFSPSTSFSSNYESQSRLSEDLTTKKKIVSSSPPPPPPPPPLIQKPVLTKSSSSVPNNAVSSSKEFKRSVKSVPQEEKLEIKPVAEESPKRRSPGSDFRARSVRTFRTGESSSSLEAKKNSVKNDESGSPEKESYMATTANKKLHKDEEVDEAVDKVLIETSDEDSETEHDDDGGQNDCSKGVSQFEEEVKNDDDSVGPDVDKKADEFIAKFREQIRLQRIESIRRSATQRAGKASIR